MTTSNKLLLGFFLVAVLALTGTQIALYAKYKAGDFEKVDDVEKERYIFHKVPPTVRTVKLVGFDNCSLSHTGEPMVQVWKHESLKRMGFTLLNDTLILVPDTTLTMKHFEEGLRNPELVRLTLPPNVDLQLDFSALSLHGSSAPSDTPAYNIQLNPGSRLGVTLHEPKETPIYFGKLNITASHSLIELNDFTTVNELNLTANNTELLAHKAVIRTSHLNIDDNTIISASKNSLPNLQLAKP